MLSFLMLLATTIRQFDIMRSSARPRSLAEPVCCADKAKLKQYSMLTNIVILHHFKGKKYAQAT